MKIRNLLPLVALLCLPGMTIAQTKKPAKSTKPAAAKTHKMPARDAKTGRFVKSSTSAKKTPARDAKTGRFVKKSGGKS